MSRLDWKFYMNNNPAVAGCGFIADADYLINNCRTKVFVGINTKPTEEENDRVPEISYVAAIGNIWKISDGELSRNIYLFDTEGDIRLHGIGFGRFEKGPIKVSNNDCKRFVDVANDLKEHEPALGNSLDACVGSMKKLEEKSV
jgi:hypothetical protein